MRQDELLCLVIVKRRLDELHNLGVRKVRGSVLDIRKVKFSKFQVFCGKPQGLTPPKAGQFSGSIDNSCSKLMLKHWIETVISFDSSIRRC